jgi:hypothetical protein
MAKDAMSVDKSAREIYKIIKGKNPKTRYMLPKINFLHDHHFFAL